MNNIELATIYLPMLDEVYKAEAKTSVLDGDSTTVRKGDNGEIKIAKIDMDGLGDFSRNSGYTKGSTRFSWETVKYDKERSQKLHIDRLEDQEALGLPFANLSSQFLRTKVIPETDAARIAKIAGYPGITSKEESLSSAANVIAALRAATVAMDNAEVNTENRILFIRPELKQAIDDADTTKSKAVLNRFSQIIEVPATRMYTGVTLNSGSDNYGYAKRAESYVKTADTDVVAGKTYYTLSGDTYSAVTTPAKASIGSYYEKFEAAKDVNFLIVERSAAVTAMDQYVKYFTPDQDQDGDSNVFAYRNNNLYGYVYDNKLAGIYCSHN